MKLTALCLLIAAGAVSLGASQRFVGGVDIVTMDVSVRRGSAPVKGLQPRDFVVTDNGVPQVVESAESGSVPVDVTLLVDTSGSMVESLDGIRDDVKDVAKLLRADDQFRLISFAGDVHEVFGFRSGRTPPPVDALTAGGWTSLYDALGLALTRRRPSARAQLIVVFSDGIDSSSTLDLSGLRQLARRSESVLHVFVLDPLRAVRPMRAPLGEAPPLPPIRAIADVTGGRTEFVRRGDDLPASFRRALEEFRTRYTVRYDAQRVPNRGWHDVEIKVGGPGEYDVRTRQGYLR